MAPAASALAPLRHLAVLCLAALRRWSATTNPDGQPRWRSPARLLTALLTTLGVLLPLLWVISGQSARLSAGQQTVVYLLAVLSMSGLSLWAFVQVNSAVLDLVFLRNAFRYHRAVPTDQWIAAFHVLEVSVYRALGKFFLVLFMGVLLLARNEDVRRWLAVHPLFLGQLIFAAMIIFTAVDVLTYLFRRTMRGTDGPISVEAMVAGLRNELVERLGIVEADVRLLKFTVRETLLPFTDTSPEPPAEPADGA